MKLKRALVALAALCGQAPTCWAWGSLVLMDARPQHETLSIGGQVMSLPHSSGSADTSQTLIPGVDFYSPSGWFASTENGVGWTASTLPQWLAGVRIWPQFGRPQADAIHAPAVGDRLQLQAFANWAPNSYLLLQSAQSVGSGLHRQGFQSEWGMTSGLPIGSDLLGLGVSATWANHPYQEVYLGQARSGWADWSWTASLTHRFNPHWHLDAQWQWAHLIEPAKGLQSRQQGGLLSVWYDY